ncbi:hypothetical protein FQV27_13540 [Paracoccus aurantiacus]|uniref:Sel1 repeat family protein n=1 Tax=Paracoccus aurantiacus TaxID=2599412 RepID=A0A5C6S2P3_9RHOB|nr:hypothetical protein [Paracoccus aurantiacus]TXB68199.1 hypothetical protein FQV27_13540 [Paracoccus aurantiacus]
MSSFASRIVGTFAASAIAALPLSASADTAPEPGFSAAQLAAGVVRMVLPYGRMIADIRYASMDVDARRGAIALHGLEIVGIDDDARCRIAVGRLNVSGLQFLPGEETRTRLDISDMSIANGCFGPQAAMIGVVTGGDTIPVQRLSLDARQVTGSGAARFDLELVSPAIGRLEGSADLDYFAFYIPDFFERLAEDEDVSGMGAGVDGAGPDAPGDGINDPTDGISQDGMAAEDKTPEVGVRGTLRSADLSFEDMGLWDRVKVILPPEATSVEGLSGLVSATPGSEMAQIQQDLVDSLVAFIASPGRVTAQIRAETPVAFDSAAWPAIEDAVVALAPEFTNSAPVPPVSLIADPSDAGDARSLGLALARGEGVPQNRRRAIGLLSPIKGDPEVSLTLAKLIGEADATAAYPHAMAAAQGGVAGASVLLSALEGRMPTAALMAAQQAAGTPLTDETFANLATIRDAALAREQGEGVPRSYALAWRLASSAAAAGDGASQALLARLDARFRGDPAWITAREAAADAAIADWTQHRLGTSLAGPTD